MVENNSKIANQDEINACWVRLIGAMVHDIKTPLATMRAALQSVEGVLPDLIQAYKVALEHKLIEPLKNEGKLQYVQNQALPILKSAVDGLFDANKSVSTYTHELLPDADLAELFIKACVDEVLQIYPFEDDTRALVKVNIAQDFKFKGIKIFMNDLLANLISNALRAIESANKGEITIWTEENNNFHELHFKDTGSGIDLKHTGIFDRYTSKRDHAFHAGLGFCRLALLLTGGDVICDSVVGEGTHFVVRFAVG